MRCCAPRAIAPGATGMARWTDLPRGRGAPATGPRQLQPSDRQQLVVSPKTAANHVEHIYAKLGVSSRNDVRHADTVCWALSNPRSRPRKNEVNASFLPLVDCLR